MSGCLSTMEELFETQECPQDTASVSYESSSNSDALSIDPAQVQLTQFLPHHQIKRPNPTATVYNHCQESLHSSTGTRGSSSVIRDPDFLEIVKSSEPSDAIGLGLYQVQDTQSSSSDNALENTQSLEPITGTNSSPGVSPNSVADLSPSESTGYMLLLSDNSTFKIVPYTLLNRQSTNSTLESPTSEEREKHLESINAAWQRHINLTNIRCILVSLSALPDMAAHKRPFFPGVDEERYTQSKKWTSGADVAIFARSKRLFPDQDPILCPYQLRGSSSVFDAYNSKVNDDLRDRNAFIELDAVLNSNQLMAPLAPDFEKLATAFFNGDSIPEDLDDIPARSKTSQLEAGITGKNHITNYDTSDWKCLLEQNIHREPIMVRFLMDVIMCNKMEKVCSSKNLTYHNASVHRDSSYIMVMDQLKVAETRQSRLNESTTDGSIWEVTLIYGPEVDIDNPPDPSEGAEEGAVVIDTFKPQSEPAPGKIKKKKNSRRKGKYNSGKAAGNDPVHVSEAEGDLQMSDRVSVKDVPLSDQGDDTSTGMSPQRQSEDAAQSMSSKENFAMTPPVIKVQDLSADTLQHTDDDNDWNIVRAKASQRAKGAPRGSTGRLQGRARLTSHQTSQTQKPLQHENVPLNQRQDPKPKNIQTRKAPRSQKPQPPIKNNSASNQPAKPNEAQKYLHSGKAFETEPEKLRIFNPEEYPAMPSITYSTPAPVNATTNKDPASSASKILNTSSEQARPNSSSAPSLDPSSSSDGDIPPENESISPQTAQNELENSDVSETAGEDQQSAISDSDTNEVAGTIDESAETPLQPFTETSQAASQALNVLLYPNSPTSAAKGSAFGENGTIKAASPVRETESGAEASEVLALSSVFDDLASPTKFGNGIRPASLPERNGTINDDDNDDNDSTGNPFNTFQNRPRTISNDTRGPPYFALHQGREYEIYDNSDTQLGSPQMLPLRFGEASPALNSFASVSVLERPVQPFNFDRRNPMFHHNGVHQALQSEYMDASGSTSAASVSNAAHQAHSGSSMNAPYSAPTYFPYQSVQGLTQGNTFQHTIHQPAVYQVPGATTSTHHFSGAPRRMMYPPPHFGAPALVMAAHTLTPIPPSGRVLDHGHPMPPARFVGTNFGSYAGASEGPGYPPNQWYGQENLGGNMEDRATNYETDEVSESPVSPEGFWGRRVPVPEIVYNCTFCHERITATVQTPFALCSGCGPSGYTYYCSVECLLLDAQTHSVHCLNYPASERAAYHNLPQQYLYVKDPLYQVDGPRESPEKFRQRTFAMYCSSGPFPNLLQAWTKVHGVPQNLEGRDISESTQKRTGDYYIFRSRQTADGLRPNPDSDVIFTIVLRNGDSLKGMLTRTLNACFLSYQPRLIEFLFRLIRYLLRDTNLFEILPHSCSQADTFAEFTHQFSLEFGFDASMQVHRTDYFNASIEWLEVFNYIAQLEVKYPVLDKWCRT